MSAYAERHPDIEALIREPDLDGLVAREPSMAAHWEAAVDDAIQDGFGRDDPGALLFLQRTLYRINRLCFFWHDELANYENERSVFLARIRARIEAAWQAADMRMLDLGRLRRTPDVEQALRERAARDLTAAPDQRSAFFTAEITWAGYTRLLEIFSLDALVEASQMSRTLGGVGNEVHAYMTRLLLEEYGGGRLEHKHSSYFRQMLEWFGMDSRAEAYFERVPWEVLAAINLSFLLAERKRHYLRYVGGLLHTETSVPAGFSVYRQAAEHLGMPDVAAAYWSVHIKTDKVHGRWMLEEVAIPLARRYPRDAWEILWGYDQQVFASDRAGAAIWREVRLAQHGERTWDEVRALGVPAG